MNALPQHSEMNAPPVAPSMKAVNALTQDLAPVGYMIVDLAAFIDGIDASARRNLKEMATLREANIAIDAAAATVEQGIEEIAVKTRETHAAAAGRIDGINANLARFERMAEWGTGLADRTAALEKLRLEITKSNSDVAQIARQVNILAVNAAIEAARAGDAGRGFAVVADAINALSRKTAEATAGISENIASLTDWSAQIRDDADRFAPDFKAGVEGANVTRTAITNIMNDMEAVDQQIAGLEQATETLRSSAGRAKPIHDNLDRTANAAVKEVSEARKRSDRMMDACESLLQHAFEIGDGGPDAPFINFAKERAKEAGRLLEDGIDSGLISADALFDFSYTPIPQSDPQQHETPFAKYTDLKLQGMLDDALSFDPAVLFVCACDVNGYIPTHNTKFSHPQGSDPAWNAGHCRNRRIFKDRTGQKAGKNRSPFLIQVYRRDMGAEGFVMMKDLSVPIQVKGRHWGAIRMGYRDRDVSGM